MWDKRTSCLAGLRSTTTRKISARSHREMARTVGEPKGSNPKGLAKQGFRPQRSPRSAFSTPLSVRLGRLGRNLLYVEERGIILP